MQNLPPHFLIEFDRTGFQPPADWLETSSNRCLFFLRTALGSTYKLTNQPSDRIKIELIEKTYTEAFRIFAGFVAFTLWLPITFVGIVMWACSETHGDAYSAFQSIEQTFQNAERVRRDLPLPQLPPPPLSPPRSNPLPSAPTLTAVSAVVVASKQREATVQSIPPPSPKQTEETSASPTHSEPVLSNEALVKALKDLVQIGKSPNKTSRPLWDPDKNVKLIQQVLKRLETLPEAQLEKEMVESLKTLLSEYLLQAEISQCLPMLIRHPRPKLFIYNWTIPSKKAYEWLTCERCEVHANLIMQRIVNGESDLWDVWEILFCRSYGYREDRIGQALNSGERSYYVEVLEQAARSMLDESLKILGENSPHLGRLYFASRESNILLKLLAEQKQLTPFAKQLRQMPECNDEVITKFLNNLPLFAQNVDHSAKDKHDSVVAVVGEDDLWSWCLAKGLNLRVRYHLIAGYIAQILARPLPSGMDPSQDREKRLKAITKAFQLGQSRIEYVKEGINNNTDAFRSYIDSGISLFDVPYFGSLLTLTVSSNDFPIVLEGISRVQGRVERQNRAAFIKWKMLNAVMPAITERRIADKIEERYVQCMPKILKTSPLLLHALASQCVAEMLKMHRFKILSLDLFKEIFRAYLPTAHACEKPRYFLALREGERLEPDIFSVVEHIKTKPMLDAAVDAAITAVVPPGVNNDRYLFPLLSAANMNVLIPAEEGAREAKIAERRKFVVDHVTPILRDTARFPAVLIPTILDYYFALPPATKAATK